MAPGSAFRDDSSVCGGVLTGGPGADQQSNYEVDGEYRAGGLEGAGEALGSVSLVQDLRVDRGIRDSDGECDGALTVSEIRGGRTERR